MNIVWFKRDLRLEDHAPLVQAAQAGAIIPLYIIEPELWQQADTSWRHWSFIHDSLQDLERSLQQYGGTLIIRIGTVLSVLVSLLQQLGALTLWSHEETGNAWTFKRDIAVAQWCKEHGVIWHQFPANAVVRGLKDRDQWTKIRNMRMKEASIAVPARITWCQDIASDPLPPKDHQLFGQNKVGGSVQAGGRSAGLAILQSFLQERAKKYMLTLSKPGVSARHCSRLSAHIAYGTLSVREIEQATQQRRDFLQDDPEPAAKALRYNLRSFLSRLAWRCHFVQKLEQQPAIETQCMHPAFEGMRASWGRDDYWQAWQEGKTGYPLIDACMRSLIQNGWITFRMRAMLVSFASYNLWLDWRQIGPYLAGLFTDYEPGIHYSQLQMQSGVTGINALRIYNPVKQSLDHDPEGKFILRYVPELQEVPLAFIHEPWKLPSAAPSYPPPIVDHQQAMQAAKAHLAQRRKTIGFKEAAKATYRKLGSRQSPASRRRAPGKPRTQTT